MVMDTNTRNGSTIFMNIAKVVALSVDTKLRIFFAMLVFLAFSFSNRNAHAIVAGVMFGFYLANMIVPALSRYAIIV